MAGIGFKLKKMLMEDTYASILKAYLYSAVISSGPWLLSIFCLSFLGILSPILLQENNWSSAQWEVFAATIVYIFAFSLILTGMITMIITRYVADKIYLDEQQAIPSAYVSVLAITIVFQGVTGAVLFAFSGEGVLYVVSATTLYITVSCIWISLIFLSASENYKLITTMFFVGSLVSLAAAILAGQFFGLGGFLSGYTLGQIIIFVGFSYVILAEFGSPDGFHLDFLSYCKDYYELVLIGVLYYVAVWADKFIFWFSSQGTQIQGIFYSFQAYDTPLFLAYVSIVPALTIFLLNIETDFYGEYRSFYEFVMAKRPYGVIHEKKLNMKAVLQRSLMDLLKIQGLVTFLAIYFAPEILSGLGVTEDLSIQVFRYAVLGAFFHAYILIITIILLYYNLRKDTLIITGFFAGTNILFTWISTNLGAYSYGAGYTVSSLISFVISYVYLRRRLEELEYLTFVSQPIVGKRDDSPEFLARPGGGYGEYVDLEKARTSV